MEKYNNIERSPEETLAYEREQAVEMLEGVFTAARLSDESSEGSLVATLEEAVNYEKFEALSDEEIKSFRKEFAEKITRHTPEDEDPVSTNKQFRPAPDQDIAELVNDVAEFFNPETE